MADLQSDIAALTIEDTKETETKFKNNHKYAGKAVIICNIEFEENDKREGAEKDAYRMNEALEKKGFVVKPYFDLNSTDMVRVLEKESKDEELLLDCDCFLCVISTHGSWDTANKQNVDFVYGSDGLPIQLRTLTYYVSNANAKCQGLKGKPKIFLLQSCRGNRYQQSVETKCENGKVVDAKQVGSEFNYADDMDLEAPEETNLPYNIPIQRDYLLHFATTPGFVAFKKGKTGTPFLRAWCDILEQPSEDIDILSMATMVNQKVALEYRSFAPSQEKRGLHERKQMPQVVSALTKDFFFGNKG